MVTVLGLQPLHSYLVPRLPLPARGARLPLASSLYSPARPGRCPYCLKENLELSEARPTPGSGLFENSYLDRRPPQAASGAGLPRKLGHSRGRGNTRAISARCSQRCHGSCILPIRLPYPTST